MACDLGLVVAVLLAGERLELHALPWPRPVAPSFIFTKNGLVSVLVISPTIGWSPEPLSPPPPGAGARSATAAAGAEREGGRQSTVATRRRGVRAGRVLPGFTHCDLSSYA